MDGGEAMKLIPDPERITIDQLTIRVKLEKKTVELFTVPIPSRQQEFVCNDPRAVRVLDNPLKENLRNYIVWGKL